MYPRVYVKNTSVDAICLGKRIVELQDSKGPRRGHTTIVRDLTLNGSHVNVAEKYSAQEPRLLRLAQRTRFKPLSETIVWINTDFAGLRQAQSTLRVYRRQGLTMVNGLIDIPVGPPTRVVVANYRRKAVTLPKWTLLGVAEPFEHDVLTPNGDDPSDPLEVLTIADLVPRKTTTPKQSDPPPSRTEWPPKDQEALKAMAEDDLEHLCPALKERVQQMIRKHEVMWTGGALGTIGATQHHIDLVPSAHPARSQPRRARSRQRDIVEKNFKRMKDAKVIRPSTSEWGAPVVIVPKKDQAPRFCIDPDASIW